MTEELAEIPIDDISCKDLFEIFIPERIQTKPELLKINAIYQFILTEEGGGSWAVDLTKPGGAVTEGMHPKPDITLTLSAHNFCELIRGKVNTRSAFLNGTLKLKGEMGLALKIQELLGG